MKIYVHSKHSILQFSSKIKSQDKEGWDSEFVLDYMNLLKVKLETNSSKKAIRWLRIRF